MYFTSFPDLFDVLRELWPILGPYALLQVMDTTSIVFTFLYRNTHLNQRLKTGSWQPQSFVTTSVRSKTLGPTPSYISQTSHKCSMTPSSSLLHTGLLDIRGFVYQVLGQVPWPPSSSQHWKYLSLQELILCKVLKKSGRSCLYQGEYHGEIVPGIEHFPGVAHSDELILEWDHLDNNYDRPLNNADAAMSLQLTRWLNSTAGQTFCRMSAWKLNVCMQDVDRLCQVWKSQPSWSAVDTCDRRVQRMVGHWRNRRPGNGFGLHVWSQDGILGLALPSCRFTLIV